MTTILIWLGSGFAFALGVLVGSIGFIWLAKKRKPTDMEIETLRLFDERNRIEERHVQVMLDIRNHLYEVH